jgi:hypothetical protein
LAHRGVGIAEELEGRGADGSSVVASVRSRTADAYSPRCR